MGFSCSKPRASKFVEIREKSDCDAQATEAIIAKLMADPIKCEPHSQSE